MMAIQTLLQRNTKRGSGIEHDIQRLKNLKALLIQRELELMMVKTEIHSLESIYIEMVGVEYARLADLEYKIYQTLSQMNPANSKVKAMAEEKRRQAEHSISDDRTAMKAWYKNRLKKVDWLKNQYKEIISTCHPALTTDPLEQSRCRTLMKNLEDAFLTRNFNHIKEMMIRLKESGRKCNTGEFFMVNHGMIKKVITQIIRRLREIKAENAQLKNYDLYRLLKEVGRTKGDKLAVVNELNKKIEKAIINYLDK